MKKSTRTFQFRILNWLRKRRILALQLAFGYVVVENIINIRKPHELLPLGEPVSQWAVLGYVLVVSGVFIRFAARGYFSKKGLITTGPYAIVRHPLYLGSLLISIGILCQLNNWMNWVVILPVFAFFHGVAIIYEERSLEEKYGEQWKLYKAEVSAFIPKVKFAKLRSKESVWTWKLYKESREILSTVMFLAIPWIIELIIEDFLFEDVLSL